MSTRMITLPSEAFKLIYVTIGLLIVLGIMLWISNPNTTVGIGGVMIFTAIMLMVSVVPLNVYANKLRELEQTTASPVPLEVTRKVPKKFARRTTPLPPPPMPEVSDWVQFTVGFIIGVEKTTVAIVKGVRLIWGELKLLIVGVGLLYLFIIETPWDWNGINVSSFEYLRFITLILGSYAVWRWITNNAKWEPKPASGGRWIAFTLVGLATCSTVIIVFAIVYMPQIIQLIRFLEPTGTSGNFQ